MRYFGMPWGMWALFHGSFQKNLTIVLGYEPKAAADITARAKSKYKEIIAKVPEFEPQDRFKMNLVNCAMLVAFLLNMEQMPSPKMPSINRLTDYYEASMMTPLMKWVCRQSGKTKFSAKDIQAMKATAALRAADRNPYSWNMEFYEYADGSGYEARFTKCGICTLMREYGLGEQIPAMCQLDYAMNAAAGETDFARAYTLASGGPYCDCGYRKKR
jgi:hypothetical protein